MSESQAMYERARKLHYEDKALYEAMLAYLALADHHPKSPEAELMLVDVEKLLEELEAQDDCRKEGVGVNGPQDEVLDHAKAGCVRGSF